MTETNEAQTRHKQEFFLANVTKRFGTRTEIEKYINEHEIEGDVAILKGREVIPTEQTKKVLN